MRLTELLRDAGVVGRELSSTTVFDVRDVDVTGIAVESARIVPGCLFVALAGRRSHGAAFASDAIGAGAVAIVTDEAGAQSIVDHSVPVIVVEDPRRLLAPLAIALWRHPAARLSMIGVTGTNGKTTVTHLIRAALNDAGIPCGIIGTLGSALPGAPLVPHPRTTPEAPDVHATLASMADAGARAVAMEVSSIALCEHRVDGIEFDVSVFTGLSHDHLDYHGSMDAYFEAKADLFTRARSRRGVVEVDDEWGRRLVSASAIPMTTVSVTGVDADWTAHREGDDVLIVGPQTARVRLAVPTDFALSNLVLAVAVANTQGVTAQRAADSAARARVPGRMELVRTIEDMDFVVDYAHTPDAIAQVVAAAADRRRPIGGTVIGGTVIGGRVIVVVGAGGDRDPGKRAAMGRSAGSRADLVIVTDDNPRSEDPSSIREAVMRGVRECGCEAREVPDRRMAIQAAVQAAQPGDIVLVLGKGHETTQEIAGHVLAFDDREVLASFVEARFGSDGEVGRR